MTTKTYQSSVGTSTEAVNLREGLLRRVLFGNVAFTVLSTALFLFAGAQVADFIGIADTMILGIMDSATFMTVLAIGLGIFAVDVLFVATRQPINVKYAWAIAIADFIWVAASWLLLATGAIQFSDAGNWAVLIVSDIVLLFGIAEVVGIRRITR